MRYFLLLSVIIGPLSGVEPATPTLAGRVTSVIDGDTFTLKVQMRSLTIRMAGIDAPELQQQGGVEAREMLTRLLKGHWVTVETAGEPESGLILGTVFMRETTVEAGSLNTVSVQMLNMNAIMVEEGWAWTLQREPREVKFAKLESLARRQRRGLWKQTSPIEPWAFRKAASAADREMLLPDVAPMGKQ